MHKHLALDYYWHSFFWISKKISYLKFINLYKNPSTNKLGIQGYLSVLVMQDLESATHFLNNIFTLRQSNEGSKYLYYDSKALIGECEYFNETLLREDLLSIYDIETGDEMIPFEKELLKSESDDIKNTILKQAIRLESRIFNKSKESWDYFRKDVSTSEQFDLLAFKKFLNWRVYRNHNYRNHNETFLLNHSGGLPEIESYNKGSPPQAAGYSLLKQNCLF